jgi:hypothetical protein
MHGIHIIYITLHFEYKFQQAFKNYLYFCQKPTSFVLNGKRTFLKTFDFDLNSNRVQILWFKKKTEKKKERKQIFYRKRAEGANSAQAKKRPTAQHRPSNRYPLPLSLIPMCGPHLSAQLLLPPWYVHFASLFYIIIYCRSLIYFIFRDDTYVVSSIFTCLMIIGQLTARVRILLEKGPSRYHIPKDQQF